MILQVQQHRFLWWRDPDPGEELVRERGVPAYDLQQERAERRAGAEEAATMFGWFENEGYQADLPALRERFPGLVGFETWLRETR
ncbi:hypothetical protein [Spongiactinospora sp. 9N601]|uniref:hypothetical protein n=1 Tax=Spongiactinospora sp. 9N601 TaxID=3375149 RepID=UPI00379904CA